MRLKWKLLVLTSFSTRFLYVLSISVVISHSHLTSDIAATSTQLYFSHGFGSPDLTSSIWQWTVLTQTVQCISIVSSCVPYLRPLLESLPSGLMLSDDLQGHSSVGGSHYAPTRDRSKLVPSTRGTGNAGCSVASVESASNIPEPAGIHIELGVREGLDSVRERSVGTLEQTGEGSGTWRSTSLESQRQMLGGWPANR